MDSKLKLGLIRRAREARPSVRPPTLYADRHNIDWWFLAIGRLAPNADTDAGAWRALEEYLDNHAMSGRMQAVMYEPTDDKLITYDLATIRLAVRLADQVMEYATEHYHAGWEHFADTESVESLTVRFIGEGHTCFEVALDTEAAVFNVRYDAYAARKWHEAKD